MIGNLLPEYARKWLWKNAWNFPNVIGFSEAWMPRERNHKFLFDKPVIRFYVTKKKYIPELKYEDYIPAWIKIRHWLKKHAFNIDVVEIKEQFAFIDKTKNFRPVELGVSVGNEAITAGSLGMLYSKNMGVDDWVFAGSNAHVVSDDPSHSPEEVTQKNILQRGSYHGGKVPDDIVGKYEWHQQIYPIEIPSECGVSNGLIWILNVISKLLGRKSRFKTSVQLTNTIDFGIYDPTVEHVLKIADDSIDTKLPFIGHLYAGSDVSGVLCSISEILTTRPDLKPLNDNWCEVKVGDRIKGCSFWCNYETEVIDTNATLTVNYGSFIALMTKAILVTNDGTIKGGWSGSGWFKVS